MFCPKCGKGNPDGSRLCVGCGVDLTRIAASQAHGDADALHRLATPGVAPAEQYDTLDEAVTQGREAVVLGGQYRIVKKLGEGGMGVVYLAEDIEMGNRPVAVKVLPLLLARNLRAVENLRKEAMVAISLTHPNIIRLHGFHSDADMKFLVMEYIKGQTLEERILRSERGRLSPKEVLPIAEQIAAGLDYAHSQGPPIFHRDLKPSNVIIDEAGCAKLLDFGIAREMKDSYTRVTGQETSGTIPYMSPQQVNGDAPNAAMDIYSLGVTLYECLSGRTPFHTGDIRHQILTKHPPQITDVPEHINRALQSALAKECPDRPPTAADLAVQLRDPGAGQGKIRRGSPQAKEARAPREQHLCEEIRVSRTSPLRIAKVLGILAGIVGAAIFIGVFVLHRAGASRAAPPAGEIPAADGAAHSVQPKAGLTVVQDTNDLKTELDKISYIVGTQFVANLRAQGVDVNTELLIRGLRDALAGKPGPFNQEQQTEITMAWQQKRTEKLRAEQGKRDEEALKKLGDKNAWKLKLTIPEMMTFDANKEYFWILDTNKGEIRIKLMPEVAPMHVTSTIFLTNNGFYDGTTFHRVIPGFMAQGGCPLGTGTGSPGYTYAGETKPNIKHDRPYLLSMANAGPNTDGSQFFITFKATPWLDGKHTIFGEVVTGQDTVKKLEAAGTEQGKPKEELKINKATIEEKAKG